MNYLLSICTDILNVIFSEARGHVATKMLFLVIEFYLKSQIWFKKSHTWNSVHKHLIFQEKVKGLPFLVQIPQLY